MSDGRTERERIAALADAVGRFGAPAGEGGSSVLVQTYAETAYPTVANAFYSVHPVEADGDEAEGDAATFTADGARTLHAYNLGSAIPPAGTVAIAHMKSGRWVFTFNCCVTGG